MSDIFLKTKQEHPKYFAYYKTKKALDQNSYSENRLKKKNRMWYKNL